ncbi:MAG: ABC transporter ATP-binding protein [Desulfohalobiaceae bacterium]|nr:ABC transporter ATP-binding protein [Desulfohalobiaceae bacterium]
MNDVSFEVNHGETYGIIGENGSGKSTLLKALTGVIIADSGSIHLQGKLTGLLELGTGFNAEFSGLQNIWLNGTYLKMSKEEIEAKRDRIIEFTELGDFIREPIKTYSSGMLMRLAFSVAIHADPQCFVVDEALSVGDAHFQQKCMKKLKDFRSKGGSIVFVSHDMNAVQVLCDRAMLLDKGVKLEEGSPEDVINSYNFLLAKKFEGDDLSKLPQNGAQSSYGTGEAVIQKALLRDAHGVRSEVLVSGEPCTVEIIIAVSSPISEATVGIAVRDRFGQNIFGVNSHHLKQAISLEAGQIQRLRFYFDEFNIGPGKYSLSVALHSGEVHVHDCYHWMDKACVFEVVAGTDFSFVGVARLTPRLEFSTVAETG